MPDRCSRRAAHIAPGGQVNVLYFSSRFADRIVMKPTPSIRFAAVAAAALVLAGPLELRAQTGLPAAKGTLKVQPRPSATSTVPAGVDTGAPGSSNSVPLGTPTTPANDAERNDMRKASAAARAAARRRATPAAPEAAASASLGAAAEAARVPAAQSNGGSPAGAAAARKVSPAPSPTPSRPAR